MTFTLRKTIQSRQGDTIGTCQVAIYFPKENKSLLPGQSMPLTMDIAHSCHSPYAIHDVKIRLLENVVRRRLKSKTYKIWKTNIPLRQRQGSKSAAMDIEGMQLDLPPQTRCDLEHQVHHYLEIKIVSKTNGSLRFKFPFAIGGEPYNWQHSSSSCLSSSSSIRKWRYQNVRHKGWYLYSSVL